MTAWLPDAVIARIAVIMVAAVLVHMTVLAVQRLSSRVLAPGQGHDTSAAALRRHPKVATVISLAVSTITFALWFTAIGFALNQLGVNLAAYFATATVIGLAVGFGSQGLVQDVVIGLTLIFTDVLDVGDTVEMSGQVGRVQRVGLRFTTLTNFLGQTVYIPNRNIAVVGRFTRGVIRAYVDVQVPDGIDADDLADRLRRVAAGFRAQHPAAILGDPVIGGIHDADPGGWRYVRIRLRLWPGQQHLVDANLRQRILAHMRTTDERYADWMVAVSYRSS